MSCEVNTIAKERLMDKVDSMTVMEFQGVADDIQYIFASKWAPSKDLFKPCKTTWLRAVKTCVFPVFLNQFLGQNSQKWRKKFVHKNGNFSSWCYNFISKNVVF